MRLAIPMAAHATSQTFWKSPRHGRRHGGDAEVVAVICVEAKKGCEGRVVRPNQGAGR